MNEAGVRCCSVSVDIDEIPNYYALHGLPQPSGAGARAVYDMGIERLSNFAEAMDIPITWFVVGSDVRNDANAQRLKKRVEKGDEIANHTLDHRYDLCLMSSRYMHEQVAGAMELIEEKLGVRPRGFRSPGYLVNDRLVDVLRECEVLYDTSVFPSVPYYGAKAAAVIAMALRGRRSRSIVDHPRVLAAPTRPYLLGKPYTTSGQGPLEFPVQVTRGLRLPYIGTSLTLAGPRGARLLTRMVIGEPMVNLELHGIDALDASDGLQALQPVQPDVRVGWQRKLLALEAAITELKQAGYSFVRLDEAAQKFGR